MYHPFRWLPENSPYRAHTLKKYHFSHSLCCGQPPSPTSLEASGLHPVTNRKYWFPILQCSSCGRYFLWFDGKGKPIDCLLNYDVREHPSQP